MLNHKESRFVFNLAKLVLILISVFFLLYIVLPSPKFPSPPPDSAQSNEPADTETPLKRAYFTNYTRQEVLDFYENQFKKSNLASIPYITYLLNYPPEDAQTLIRDQTRSTFLEEIVHPFRESFYVNGFEPKDAKDTIIINGVHWRQKITVKFVPSKIYVRVAFGLLTIWLIYLLSKEYVVFLYDLVKDIKKK